MVKLKGIIRKTDSLGRVVLPIESRNILGIEKDDDLEVSVDEKNGCIILKKAFNKCIRCESKENLKEIKPGYYICVDCIKKLN